jgi:hypothetical protein
MPITAADLLNDKVLPFFAEQGMSLIRILTDRGMEYCGKPESHGYPLYLALNDIEHTKTKVRHPQPMASANASTRPSCEELQLDVDNWLLDYNNDRTHQGKMCCGRTPMQTLINGKEAWHDKITTLNS